MRSRGSIVGPLILITIGVLFLMRTVWPEFSVFDLLAQYWPYLLITWGVLQLIEITVRFSRSRTIATNGIGGGGWFLVVLICLAGFTAAEVRGPETWWRRVSFDQGMDWFGQPHDYGVADQSKPAGKNPHIVIESFRGNAKIIGSDANDIELSGHKTIRAMKEAEANRADQITPVELIADGNNFIVRCNQDRAQHQVRVSTDLELKIPKGASLDATGRAGDFDVTNLDGNVNINSDNAGVRLQDLGGNVKIDTRRGDVVRCTNIRGAVELKGRNSDLELRKVAGQVTISGTYAGTINLRELAKPVHIDNVETALNVQKVPGQITMDRGNFSAQDIVGPLELTTHATDVDLAGFAEPIEIKVDKGDVNLRPGKHGVARMTVSTRSGNIDLALPDAAKFDLKASTDHGEIENEFGNPLRLVSEGRGARLSGSVGTGPTLTLTTDRGTITVRKSNGDEPPPKVARIPSPDQDEDEATAPAPPQRPKQPKPPELKAPTVEL